MRDTYHAQLDELHNELKEMGALCEQAVNYAVKAASTGSSIMGDKAKEADSKIDRKERDIEALCMKLLLKQQPVAGELRDISAALSMRSLCVLRIFSSPFPVSCFPSRSSQHWDKACSI